MLPVCGILVIYIPAPNSGKVLTEEEVVHLFLVNSLVEAAHIRKAQATAKVV